MLFRSSSTSIPRCFQSPTRAQNLAPFHTPGRDSAGCCGDHTVRDHHAGPTRPLPRAAVWAAMARASPEGQPGNSFRMASGHQRSKTAIRQDGGDRPLGDNSADSMASATEGLAYDCSRLVRRCSASATHSFSASSSAVSSDQYALAFVMAARPAETNNHGRYGAVLPSTPRQGGVAAGQIDQMVKIRTTQGKEGGRSPGRENLLSVVHGGTPRILSPARCRRQLVDWALCHV